MALFDSQPFTQIPGQLAMATDPKGTIMTTFTLSITLGNEAMQSPEDIADALDRVAEKLRSGWNDGPVRDVNGNAVGEWRTD